MMVGKEIEIWNQSDKTKALKWLNGLKRKGPAYLKPGQHVSKEQLLQTFGFKEFSFDRGISRKERQLHLDMAYEGFMDMAQALEINPNDISLNGKLSVEFKNPLRIGSRISPACTSYTRGLIGLNRTDGAGCFAHEWAHAIDSQLSFFLCFSKGHLTSKAINEGKDCSAADIKIPEAMPELVRLMKNCPARAETNTELFRNKMSYPSKARTLKQNESGNAVSDSNFYIEARRLDRLRLVLKNNDINKKVSNKIVGNSEMNEYYASIEEMFARSFESYIESKLSTMGIQSQYVSLIYPAKELYPYGDEKEKIDAAFNELFKELKDIGFLHEWKESLR